MAFAEKDFQTEFNKWLVRRGWDKTTAFELKITKKDYINFKEVKPHQLRNLLLAKQKMIYKIPDVGMDQKPFDSFIMCDALAYVVILFYQPRKPKQFAMIEVDAYKKEALSSDRASLTLDRAREIGKIYLLNE